MADAPVSPQLPRWGIAPIVAGVLLFAFGLFKAFDTQSEPDLFIYRLGAEFLLRHENPYDVAKVRAAVTVQFPDGDPKHDSFVNNCGYFLPPAATLLYLPFAILPWVGAKVAWAVVLGFAGYAIARVPELLCSAGAPPPAFLFAVAVPFVLVVNPLLLAIVGVGQVTPVCVACVVAGLFAFERKKPSLAAILWVIPFVKPHVALPLIPLAYFLGGWRPTLLLVALVGGLNLVGAWAVGGSPLFLREYLDFLPQAREAVLYNRAAENSALTSWNRLLFALGGPLVELTAVTTVAGYLVWFGLVLGRCALANVTPSATWACAAAAAGAMVCSQVIVSEGLILVIAVPWLRDLHAGGWKLRCWLGVALLLVHPVAIAVSLQTDPEIHHPLAVLLFALLVLTGPLTLKSPAQSAGAM